MSACLLSFATTDRPVVAYPDSPQSADGRFRNATPRPAEGVAKIAGILWNFLFNKPDDTVPRAPLPVAALTRAQLEAAPDRSLFRLGHSTLLLKLRGGFWITDPVFAERASPLQWMGPRRFHAPPIALADLPPLRGVLLSHDHYDHLDRDTVVQLAKTAEVFLTPLGVGDRLIAWGVPAGQGAPARLVAGRVVRRRALHRDAGAAFFRARAVRRRPHAVGVVGDRRRGGRCGGENLRLFFSGDTGYFDGFREIGRRFGPFDVTMIETGAYDPQWAYVHMLPEQTVQAHEDLRGRWLLPVHNGTFDLAMHAWRDPFERVTALSAERAIALATPMMGERFDLSAPQPTTAWWREVE